MADINFQQQGFIIEARDKADQSIAKIPENRTLLVADLTDRPATKPEMSYQLETMDDVFNKFKPESKLEFEDEQGRTINEVFQFHNMADFKKDAYVEKSKFLRELNQKKKDHETFAKRLQANRALQNVLKDAEKKEAYVTLLKAMLSELEG